MKSIIVINRARCNNCNEIIKSLSVHDFKWCKCHQLAIDGGDCYIRRVVENENNYIDLNEIINIENEYKVDRVNLKQLDFKERCCVCNSADVLLYKGDGSYIEGYDILGYICHACKCLYIFNDIKFK